MIVGTSVWFAICLSMKTTLRMLLSYQGYMFEGRGKRVSLRTKIWAILLKGFLNFKFQIFSQFPTFFSNPQMESTSIVQFPEVTSIASSSSTQRHNSALFTLSSANSR
jgi:hypothetical protein